MQWNFGGWFGGQLGGTVWIFVAGALTAVRDIPTALIVVLLFAIPNIVGILLWRHRKMSCYASTQLLMGLMGVCGLLTVYVLDRGSDWKQIQFGQSISSWSAYGIVALVFAILMLTFHLRFGRDSVGPAD